MSFFYDLYKRDLGDFFFVHVFKWQNVRKQNTNDMWISTYRKKVKLFKKLYLKKIEK